MSIVMRKNNACVDEWCACVLSSHSEAMPRMSRCSTNTALIAVCDMRRSCKQASRYDAPREVTVGYSATPIRTLSPPSQQCQSRRDSSLGFVFACFGRASASIRSDLRVDGGACHVLACSSSLWTKQRSSRESQHLILCWTPLLGSCAKRREGCF